MDDDDDNDGNEVVDAAVLNSCIVLAKVDSKVSNWESTVKAI